VQNQNNGRSIYKPIETAYLHADSVDYGWGAVLNDDSNYQARGFGPLPTGFCTSHGMSCVRFDTRWSPFYPKSKADNSSYTRTIRQWSPPKPSSPPGHPS
jgi:hypothetical protein